MKNQKFITILLSCQKKEINLIYRKNVVNAYTEASR